MIGGKLLSASAAVEPKAIEDVFSTYLYTGNGSTQTITNGIDLAGEGGLVWIKERGASGDHSLFDTNRGAGYFVLANSTAAQAYALPRLSSFNASGFSLGANNITNANGSTYASWTFRQAPRFFDVVTYTGNGTSQSIPHNLESTPGCIIVKATSSTGNWVVHHRSIQSGISYRLVLESNLRTIQASGEFTGVSSTTFSVGSAANVNSSGVTYVAYLFAHNAGGFGNDGNQNVVTCSNYTGNGSATGPTVNLGYEPQWLLIRREDEVDGANWYFFDNMRGVATGGIDNWFTQTSAAEASGVADYVDFTSTGFQIRNSSSEINANNDNYIYIAIRRGPMREPTVGTEVFSANTSNAATGTKITTGFPVDMQITGWRTSAESKPVLDRLRVVSTNATDSGTHLFSNSTAAEVVGGPFSRYWDNTGFQVPAYWSNTSTVFWNFRRAPGFFDMVAYSGQYVSGAPAEDAVRHNLGVAPEMVIVKKRSFSGDPWRVQTLPTGTNYMNLNNTDAAASGAVFTALPDATYFYVDSGSGSVNYLATDKYIAYLFASLPGISKVGSYTGNGSSQTINCGFTTGARFILIKRTDSTGDWYVWDTARGIVSGNDPRLILNTAAAEVTTDDTIDPANSGFIVNQVAATNVNVNAATYIYLAIA